MAVTVQQARAAKETTRWYFERRNAHIRGIGLTKRFGEPALRVDLDDDPNVFDDVPERIDGVFVVVVFSGGEIATLETD